MSEKKTSRCAIYTRKSSEEGLEQDFNSLEAQREACEAYIRSQAHEGWKLVSDRFDDGGFSGGNMDRPGLAKLMDLVRDGRIDVIVIYKIDRLTRSLTDFARLAETFDKHGVSFVSVTQQFNTTTSMGRLMLNVLLSFAQFEREITGERIRDKIAASKKKGMWMGGPIPMGYSVKDRQLIINEAEATSVRRIFELYLDEGTVPALLERLVRELIKTPIRVSAKGKETGGRWFTRGHIYKLLSNPLYVGRVVHKGTSHPGQHQAIVDPRVWDAVQVRLTGNTQGERTRRRRAEKPQPLLAHKLFTVAGNRMVPMHAMKGGRRYGYYVEITGAGEDGAATLLAGAAGVPTYSGFETPDGANRRRALRLPAVEIETVVVRTLCEMLGDSQVLLEQLGSIDAADIARCVTRGARLSKSLGSAGATEVLRSLMTRIDVSPQAVAITIDRNALRSVLYVEPPATGSAPAALRAPLVFRRRGKQLKLSMNDHRVGAKPAVDSTLVTAVARAFDWFDRLASGRARSIDEIAATDGFDAAYVSHLIRLAHMAPDRVEGILAGSNSTELTADFLVRDYETSSWW